MLKKSLFLLTVEKAAALFMKIAVIGKAVWNFNVCCMTPLGDVTRPLVISAHHTHTPFDMQSQLQFWDVKVV